MKLAETLVVEGPEVAEEWCVDDKGRQKCAAGVREWLDRGLSPDQIMVLSPRAFAQSTIGSIEAASSHAKWWMSAWHTPDTSRIRFSTIAGFKGLEADAVLLTDLEDLDDPDSRALFYVGASRAKLCWRFS